MVAARRRNEVSQIKGDVLEQLKHCRIYSVIPTSIALVKQILTFELTKHYYLHIILLKIMVLKR